MRLAPASSERGPCETAIIYSYAQAKGTVLDMKFHNKVLLVSFDAKDVVTDVEFVSSGTN